MNKIIVPSLVVLIILLSAGTAGSVQASAKVSQIQKSDYVVGAPANFSVLFDVLPADLVNVRARVDLINAGPADVASLNFNNGLGWTNVALAVGNSGSLSGQINVTQLAGNTASFQAVFNTVKSYVLGVTLTNAAGQTISSASIPLKVQPKVLGALTAPPFTKYLVRGSTGQQVANLQTVLQTLGFYQGPITGTFGVQTAAALKAYQQAHGIAQTGTLGPVTRASLNSQL